MGLSNFGLQTCGTRWQPDSTRPPLKAWLSRGRQDWRPARRAVPGAPDALPIAPSPGRQPAAPAALPVPRPPTLPQAQSSSSGAAAASPRAGPPSPPQAQAAAAAPPQAPTRLVIHYTGLCDFVWSLMS